MRYLVAVLLLGTPALIWAQGYRNPEPPLAVSSLPTRQADTYKRVKVPNGTIFGVPKYRTVTEEVKAVPHVFRLAASNGEACDVTAMVAEDRPVMNDQQTAESGPACDQVQNDRAEAALRRKAETEAISQAARGDVVAPSRSERERRYLRLAIMTPRDFQRLSPEEQKQVTCDTIAEKIDMQLDYERLGSSGIYNLSYLRRAGPTYCRAYLMSIQ